MTSCSSICTSWIAITSSCPPLACTNALLWPFRCAVWPFVALLQYEAWSGICVATIYDSSPCRDCRPAAPHTTATNIIASAPMLHTLLNAALSCATKRAYRRAISSYANCCRFHFPVVPVFPASACVLGAFIAHLPSQRYAPATFMTYVSAISYVHRLAGKVDPTQLFVINKLLVGAKKLSGTQTLDFRSVCPSFGNLWMLLNLLPPLCLFATSPTKHVSLGISCISTHSRHNDSHSIIKIVRCYHL